MKGILLPSPDLPDEIDTRADSSVRPPLRRQADLRTKNVAKTAGEPIGPWSRRLNTRAAVRRQNPIERVARRLGIRLLDFARIVFYVPRLGPLVARQFGVPVGTQLVAQWRMAFRHGMDPSIYYFEELYKPGALDKLDQYFLRRELKGPFFHQLHRLQPPAGTRRINLGDKMQLFAWAERAGLAHVAPLMLIEDGQSVWQTAELLDLDQDLFVKPRVGRGASGVALYRRIGAFRYLDPSDRKVSLGQIVSAIVRRFGTSNVMVLPRLRNHPALADMATESLIAIRAVTVLDENLEPELVVAYLRILTKLEPDWPVKKPITEYAAAVDLKTGRLQAMTGDKPECLSQWYDRHPVTGVEAIGRLVPCWDEIVALAKKAHRVASDRVLVGWDIAVTPQGPMLLEGNSYPDMHFPQRIYRRPYGEMRIGALLRFHMARMEAAWDAGQ